MNEDISLRRTARGKFSFVWDKKTGSVVFDRRAAYPVLSTLHTHKGAYYWDATGRQGTQLYTVRQDRIGVTTSQLSSFGLDALKQCQAAGFLDSYSASAERLRAGVFALSVKWTVAGSSVAETVRV